MRTLFSWRGHAWISLALRWYLGVVFLMACWHKILHPASFAMDVATYDILPLALINPMAIILPWVELAAAVLLIVGFKARAASLLVVGMMVMFVVSLLMAMAKGLDMSCGCFASQSLEEDPISGWTVLRDLGWLVGGMYVLVFDRRSLGLDAWLARRSDSHG